MFAAIRKTSAWPLPIQFTCTIAVIMGAFLAEFPLEEKGNGTPFTLFVTCVCMITILFGRPSGFFAVALSAPLGTLFFRPVGSFQVAQAFDLFQIGCYVAFAVCAILVLDQVRRALILFAETNAKLEEESTQKTLQLREVAHRMANNFASLDALIRQRAMASKDPKIQFAFEQASELVHVVARLNHRLSLAASDSKVDSGVFVPDLCEDLQACARDGIRIECNAESHDLALGIAVPLGLIINELVTNAFKYAFPDERLGRVVVGFSREGGHYHLLVEDNGIGMSKHVKGSGLGLHLLRGFSRAIDGKIDIRSTSAGTLVAVKFEAPFDHEIELHAAPTMIH
jgi:two-component system, sensor histidine kinase PdtaS